MIRPSLVLALLAALLVPHTANATTIVFLEENRQVAVNGVVQSYVDAGFWSSSLTQNNAAASQTTTISTGFIGGNGSAQRLDDPAASASSFLATKFTIDDAYLARLDVELFEAGFGFTRVYLADHTRGSLLWDYFGDTGSTTINRETLLAPGTYSFVLDADHGYPFSAIASFDGGVTLSPISGTEVPEPASMTLFGLGLFGVAARKLRGRQRVP